MEAREDGVYITYVPSAGADPVTKKLSSNKKCTLITGCFTHKFGSMTETRNFTFKINYDASGDAKSVSVSSGGSGKIQNGANDYTISVQGYTIQ